ncbi:MAG: CoA-binding protein [Candidatus Micrarchaeota archaeon]|nr:CoA-binding protein [Candidatus Micrarchaeota archaeon]
MNTQNENSQELELIRDLLLKSRKICIVGLSDKLDRPSFHVAKYLQENGYEIIPINPNIESWNNIKAYRSIKEVTKKIDIVDYFIRPENVFSLVQEALNLPSQFLPRAIWLQEGITCDKCKDLADQKKVPIVMDKCIMKMHYKIFKDSNNA